MEGFPADRNHCLRKLYRCQTAALVECRIANGLQILGKTDAFESDIVFKSISKDGCHHVFPALVLHTVTEGNILCCGVVVFGNRCITIAYIDGVSDAVDLHGLGYRNGRDNH